MSSRIGKHGWVWLAGAVGSLVAVGFLVHFIHVARTVEAPEIQPLSPHKPPDEKIIAAAAARIAEESLGSLRSPAVVAAPTIAGSPNPDVAGTHRAPTPPRGHTFVDHFGEMTKAPRASGNADDPDAGYGPGWLNSTSAVAALAQQAVDARRNWSFGWIRLAGDATRYDLTRQLAGTGGEIVGSSGRLIRARLPGDSARLRAIAALDAVDGIGATPREVKLAAFADDPATDPYGHVPVYVTLMADDEDGRWRRAMADLGAVVGGYDTALRVYRANASQNVIEALAAADFVLAVEPIGLVNAAHDTAVPAMGADALRTHDGSPGMFSGTAGASVAIAVMDTGLNINHLDIATHRDSICGANFAYDSGWFGPEGPLVEAEDLWIDSDGHGTHVTGTIAGNGFVEQRFAGMAPGVRHIRFAKVLDSYGGGFGDSIRQGMDFLATASGCSEAGRMSERVKPLIVNMSLSSSARIFEGRDVGARKLDATVWSHRQLYVVAQSNRNIHGFSNYGAAKNSLAVGAATDSGALASFSSHGPTADGRLAPNVVGTGVRVHSALGGGVRGGYRAFNGTSMASPAVAGVAALLMDAVPAHKEHPALARARLMASAIRPDPWLTGDAGFALDNTTGPGPLQARFGMGKVSARTAALNRDQGDGWRSGSATAELEDGEYAYQDIEVPAGAHRLDIVLTWDEPPADAVASTVLNDLDLWLDRDGDCGADACGEHSSRSRMDNVEWIIVRNPTPGVYRAKVLAHRIYAGAPRAALAWTVIRGASTPTLAVATNRERIEGDGDHELTLTLTADAYVAAGTRLHVDCRAGGATTCNDLLTIEAVAVRRKDGLALDPADETQSPVPSGYSWTTKPISLGSSIPVGEIAAGDEREVSLRISVAGSSDDDDVRLYFTASGWNARAGSVSVGVGSGDVPEIDRPMNDDFAAATAIDGEEGTEALDLLHATPEPGEPVFDASRGRPAGSVWYSWTAPSDGLFEFEVPVLAGDYTSQDNIARYDRVHVFLGDRLTGLREVASALWQAAFFAEKGQTYHVRVGSSSRGAAIDLRWSPGARPVNDDFEDAVVLDGQSGSVDGSSAGATLEPGESFGTFTATTWFRWVAPSDGFWEFHAPGRVVLAFEGDNLAALRLVSTRPSFRTEFPAGASREYRVAVAERDAAGLGGDYTLRWDFADRTGTGNDLFEAPESLGDGSSSEHVIAVDRNSTVEPDEPLDTGVRTRWWSWEAPGDDLYTWRIEDVGEFVPRYPKLRVTLFTGASLADLLLVAQTGPGAPFDFLLDATGGEQYRIAAGLANGHAAAYELSSASGKLVWGATPDNDDVAGAVAITGAAGSVAGSNAFATGARGERSVVVGRSTLWWTYEAPASGWGRFAVDGDGGAWALTVHRDAADGLGGLDVVGSDRWQRSEGEVLFEAREGVRYTISLGVRGGRRGGEFTLRWEEADDPGWLRYAGRLADGDRDSKGNPVEIRNPGDLAVHASGTALYLASGIGLQVFEPDSVTGQLDAIQLIETDFDLAGASLIWDRHGNRLVANAPADCSAWRSYSPVDDGPQLADGGELVVADDPGNCGRSGLLIDPGGSHLYRYGSWGLDVYELEASGLGYLQSERLGHVLGAALSSDGEHLYALTSSELRVFERAADSGMLASTDFAATIHTNSFLSDYSDQRVPLAISDDGGYLVVANNVDPETVFFSLEDPLRPEQVAALPMFWDRPNSYGRASCGFADIRAGSVAVDVLCGGLALAARWDPSTLQATGTDAVASWQGDRFNGAPPDFAAPLGFAASPDDRYLYLSTPSHGIVIFGRGAPPADGGGPDLVVGSPSVDDAGPAPGAAFTLSAAVRNEGEGDSATTTLLFYRSTDASITPGDTAVGSAEVPGIAASGTSQHSINLTAPNDPGTYHYGACVDEVADEADVENNCSTAVAVTVAGSGDTGEPDLVVESPSVDDDGPAPNGAFTLTVVVRNPGDASSAATTLRYYRSSNTTITTRDTEVGTDAVVAIAAGGSRTQSIDLTAPADPGMYHYGACVDEVADESDVENNCSTAVTITVAEDTGSPDLVVRSPAVDEASPAPGGAFVFSATVANDGDASAASTTLRYYRSINATISRVDTEVGTDQVAGLAASGTTDESIELTAPDDAGTYYYGACVDSVDDESNTGNNCSDSVAVTVSDDGAPDLIVESPSVSESEVSPGGSFTLGATVRNRGDGDAPATTLRYYRSSNATVSRGDTEVGTDEVAGLAASGTTGESIELTAPGDAGSYYYGACVDSVDDESNTGNNCSGSVAVTVSGDDGAPDLIVESPSVSDASPDPGASFTLDATVRNAGDGAAAATTLRYYRSDDASISAGDTEVGTDAVAALAAGASSAESISLTAPSSAGTYYYGTCVDTVSGESDTANNCSQGVAVTVSTTPAATCAVELQRDTAAGGTETVSFTPSNAQSAEVGTSNVPARVDADMDSANDFDVYEFSLGTEGWFTLLSGGSLDTQAVFVAEDCSTVEDVRYIEDLGVVPGIRSSNSNFYLDGDLQDGTYYIVVFEWAGATGDYQLDLYFDDPLVNDTPLIRDIADQEIAVDDTATVVPPISDDRSDTHTVTATSDNTAVATVAVTQPQDGDPAIVITAVAEGTATVTVGADDQHGASAVSVEFDVDVTVPTLTAPMVEPGDAPGHLSVTLTATFDAGETKAFDYQDRRKEPQGPWDFVGCVRFTYAGSSRVAGQATATITGTSPGVIYEVRYRDRGAAACDEGTPTRWSAVGQGASGGAGADAPDLRVESPAVDNATPDPGGSITFSATVRNQGDAQSNATTLRYYRSSDSTISSGDTEVGTDAVGGLAAGAESAESISLTAPSDAGTYYYGACVDSVAGESDTANNCSTGVKVDVGSGGGTAPDLVVESTSVDDATPDAGASFTLSATVSNWGDDAAGATTLRYYRSSNATISSGDAEVGTDSVAGLAAGANGAESISLTAPSDAGTYYYGACVDSVSGESDTANNCSDGVEVEVSDGDGGDTYCRDGDTVEPGGQCDIYDTTYSFDVDSNGRGCLRASFTSCSTGEISIRNVSGITFVADRDDDADSWTIDEVSPSPPD